MVPSGGFPSARILLTCKTPVSLGASGGTAPPPGVRRPRSGVPRPPGLSGSAFAPPPPRPPGRRQPRPRGALRRPAPRPSCGRPLPAAPAAFRGSLLKFSLPSFRARGREAGVGGWGARGPHVPPDVRGSDGCWAPRPTRAGGEPPAPLGGAVLVGVRVLRGERWGRPPDGWSPSPGAERAPAATAAAAHPDCHLRDTRPPAGYRGGRRPAAPARLGHRRSEPGPAAAGTNPALGARQSPPPGPLPCTPPPGSCQSKARPSLSGSDAPPSARAFRLRHSPRRRAGWGGGVGDVGGGGDTNWL